MKLKLEVTGEAAYAKGVNEVVIRNPNATTANLRAAVAVLLKIPLAQFKIHLNGTELKDESAKLAAIPLKDDDIIRVATIAKPAAQESDSLPAAPPAKASRSEGGATAAASGGNAAAANERRSSPQALAALRDLLAHHMTAQGIDPDDDDDDEEDDDDFEGDSEDDGSLMDDMAFEGLEGLEEGEGDLEEDDEEFAESDDDEADPPELEDQAQIVIQLMSMPNFETIKARFDADPQAVMSDIQVNNPDLFNLIARHTAFFLEFLNAGAEVHGAAATSAASATRATTTRPRASAPSTSIATTSPAPPRQPSADDLPKIDSLMQLGFSRERATEAYFKAGRNPDRAAALLFDSDPAPSA